MNNYDYTSLRHKFNYSINQNDVAAETLYLACLLLSEQNLLDNFVANLPKYLRGSIDNWLTEKAKVEANIAVDLAVVNAALAKLTQVEKNALGLDNFEQGDE